jgi:DNA mismatch repair protein MutH
LIKEEWEDSDLFNMFSEQKYLFLVFRFTEEYQKGLKRIPYFEDIKLWNMPQETIEAELFDLWADTRRIVREGVELVPKGNRVNNNLPGSTFNNICHVRSKAQDGKDKVLLPDGQWITKQSYWLDKEYIQKILDKR